MCVRFQVSLQKIIVNSFLFDTLRLSPKRIVALARGATTSALVIRADKAESTRLSGASFQTEVSLKQLSQNEQRTIRALQKLFSNNMYLLEFFLDDCQSKIRFRPDEMRWRAQGHSSGEQVLIRVGLDIWGGSGDAKVWELLEILDNDNFQATLESLLVIKKDRTWPYDHF